MRDEVARLVLTASSDEKIMLWNPDNGALVKTLHSLRGQTFFFHHVSECFGFVDESGVQLRDEFQIIKLILNLLISYPQITSICILISTMG